MLNKATEILQIFPLSVLIFETCQILRLKKQKLTILEHFIEMPLWDADVENARAVEQIKVTLVICKETLKFRLVINLWDFQRICKETAHSAIR